MLKFLKPKNSLERVAFYILAVFLILQTQEQTHKHIRPRYIQHCMLIVWDYARMKHSAIPSSESLIVCILIKAVCIYCNYQRNL